MPTYDYVCDACDHKFEQFQSIKDDVLTKCPACKKKKLRRLFGTGAAIVFKGSGFYQTDYRSDSYKKSAAADKSGSDAGGSSASSGSAASSGSTSGAASSGSSSSGASGGGGSAGSSPAKSAAKPKSDS